MEQALSFVLDPSIFATKHNSIQHRVLDGLFPSKLELA